MGYNGGSVLADGPNWEGNEMRVDVNELPEDMAELAGKAWFAREVGIVKDGQPWVKLIPHDAYRPQVKIGLWDGQYELPEDFCDTPEDIIDDFYR